MFFKKLILHFFLMFMSTSLWATVEYSGVNRGKPNTSVVDMYQWRMAQGNAESNQHQLTYENGYADGLRVANTLGTRGFYLSGIYAGFALTFIGPGIGAILYDFSEEASFTQANSKSGWADYERGYAQAFKATTGQQRRAAFVKGGLVGSIPWFLLAAVIVSAQ